MENDAHYFSEYLDKQIYAELAGYERVFVPREAMLEEVETAGDSKQAGRQVQSVLQGAATHTRWLAENSRNRLRVFGDAVSHAAAGIEYQQVMEILDKKTCAICRERNGTIVPTQEVVAWIGRVVDAGPGKLDETAPWIGTGVVAEHRQLSSKELCQQGKALPLYHAHCRGMVNAFQGDPGKPGTGLRGGEGTRRRSELDKLLPAELQARMNATRANAVWLPENWANHVEERFQRGQIQSPEQFELGVQAALENTERAFTYYYGSDAHPTWAFYGGGWVVRISQKNGLIATAIPQPVPTPRQMERFTEVPIED